MFTVYYYSSNFDKKLLDRLLQEFDSIFTFFSNDRDDVIELRNNNSVLLRAVIKKQGGAYIVNTQTQKAIYVSDPTAIVDILKLRVELECKPVTGTSPNQSDLGSPS